MKLLASDAFKQEESGLKGAEAAKNRMADVHHCKPSAELRETPSRELLLPILQRVVIVDAAK